MNDRRRGFWEEPKKKRQAEGQKEEKTVIVCVLSAPEGETPGGLLEKEAVKGGGSQISGTRSKRKRKTCLGAR